MSRPIRRLIMCLFGVLAAIVLPVGAAAAASPPALTEAQAQHVGTDAYVYGISLMEYLRQQKQNTSVTVPNKLGDAPVNQLGSDATLATPNNAAFVAPNLDTLYTFGHLNLTKGPLVLHVPRISGGATTSSSSSTPIPTSSTTSARARPATAPATTRSSARNSTGSCPPGCTASTPPTRTSGSPAAPRSTAPPTSRPCTRSRPSTS